MIIRKLPLLIVIFSIFCISCSEDSASPAKEENIITKSKTKPEHYIPLDINNMYKYEMTASKTNKVNNNIENFNKIIDVSVWMSQYYTLKYTIDTNWANYFGRDQLFQIWTNTSDVYRSIDANFETFHFAIDNDGLVSKNLLVDTTYTEAINISNEVYQCVVIEEKKNGGMGRCVTHYAQGIGAVMYRYEYQDKSQIILSTMKLISCDVK